MAESKKGHNFAIQGPNTCSLIFVLMLQIKFQFPSSSGSLVTKGVTDRRTDG